MRARWVEKLGEPAAARRRAAGYVLAVVGPIVLALALLPVRDHIRGQTAGFLFLVLVVAVAAVGRFGPGALASLVAFLAFNFVLIPPYGTFAIERPEDTFSLFVFLGVSLLVSFLFAHAAERADAAEAREAELATLQGFSRDLVVHGPGDDTYRLVIARLVDVFGFDRAALFVHEEGEGLVERIAVNAAPGDVSPHWDPRDPGPAPERLPLSVGNRALGLIVLAGTREPLLQPEGRVLRAVCDQLALVLERDRLLHAATAAEVLRQTDEVRRGMLAAVSHDLRSPLAAIKASVTDLLDAGVDRTDADRGAVLRTIDAETDRLDSLVANLLDMSRIEAGVLRARPEHVDVAEVVAGAVDVGARRWPDVSFVPQLDERDTVAFADPVFLDRVLSNLLDNAGRASRGAHPRVVEVRTGRTGADVAISVVDHGPGVDPKAREMLFYPFPRLRERSSQLGPGLGLAISKGFVDLMGGSLWVEDTPGGGATFVCTLPRGER